LATYPVGSGLGGTVPPALPSSELVNVFLYPGSDIGSCGNLTQRSTNPSCVNLLFQYLSPADQGTTIVLNAENFPQFSTAVNIFKNLNPSDSGFGSGYSLYWKDLYPGNGLPVSGGWGSNRYLFPPSYPYTAAAASISEIDLVLTTICLSDQSTCSLFPFPQYSVVSINVQVIGTVTPEPAPVKLVLFSVIGLLLFLIRSELLRRGS
jgi:hypothetical protein